MDRAEKGETGWKAGSRGSRGCWGMSWSSSISTSNDMCEGVEGSGASLLISETVGSRGLIERVISGPMDAEGSDMGYRN